MAHLIKNQVFKHLAKYFKNLSTDSFKLNAMKGFCELHNLELNEEVLMDLLELPVWLNITRATCSHAAIKIPWSKLVWSPICLGLDEVNVQVEICENFRTFKNQTTSSQNTSKYGFISRTIDGIRITISSVVVQFSSPFLSASFSLSQLEVESRSGNWKPVNDLRYTTYRDKERGLVLVFKHIEWQTMKFEAKTESTACSATLRLICQGSCRLMIKKKISDSQVMGARIVVLFNDVLWVLTDAMLVSAFHFVTYINGLIKRTPITKTVLEEPANLSNKPAKVKLATNSADVKKYLQTSKLFSFETSYHLVINCLQVQICDDLDPEHGRSSLPSLREGGALHIVVNKFILDVYPYQKALGNRDNWLKYGDPSANRDPWIKAHLFEFAESLTASSPKTGSPNQRLADLFSSVILLRIGDYTVKCVSTAASRRGGGRKFGAESDERKLLCTGKFPRDIPAFYLEFNQFYYYEFGSTRVSRTRPFPDPVLFANVAPIKILFDTTSLIWLNALQSNLLKPIMELKQIIPRSETNVIILSRFEILMPTIIIDLGRPLTPSSPTDAFQTNSNSYKNIESIQLNCSRVVITNAIQESTYSDRLKDSLLAMGNCKLFIERENFPWIKGVHSKPISSGFLKLMESENLKYHSQIWIVDCDPVWVDLVEPKSSGRTKPLVDPFQVTIWAYLSADENDAAKTSSRETDLQNPESDINIVLCVPSSIKISIDHEGYLFLLRILERFDQFNDYLTNDSRRIEAHHQIESSKSPRVSIISLVNNVGIEILLLKEERLRNHPSAGSSVIGSDHLSPLRSSSHYDAIKSSDPLSLDLHDVPLESSGLQPDRSSLSDRSHSVRDSDFNESVSGFEIISDLSPMDDDDRSIRSDLSDDFTPLMNLDSITLDDDTYFVSSGSPRVVEEAMEATEAGLDSDDLLNLPKTEIISLSLIRANLETIAFVKQAHGFQSSLLAYISGLKFNEFQKISHEEYKSLQKRCISKDDDEDEFEKDNNDHIENQLNHQSNDKPITSCLTVRLDSILNPSQKSDLCSVNIDHLKKTLTNETLLQLLDFLTDPDATQVLPILVYLQDVGFKLVDDLLKTPPLTLNLKETLIQRSKENCIHILPSTSDGCTQLLRSRQSLLTISDEPDRKTDHSSTNLPDMAYNDSPMDQIMMENKRLRKEILELKQQNLILKNILGANRDP